MSTASTPASVLLDRATAARETSVMTALVLLRTGGDAAAAIELLDDIGQFEAAEPQGDELDATTIAAQAIREASAMRGEAL